MQSQATGPTTQIVLLKEVSRLVCAKFNSHFDKLVAEKEDVIVFEEPPEEGQNGPRVVRVPRSPTQAEIDAHSATHLPHAEWCEFCKAGRGRNKPHAKRKKAVGEAKEGDPGCHEDESGMVGSSSALAVEEAASHGPVPRVCMDYFYVFSRH